MSALLEFREKLKLIYGRNDIYIIPVVKFLLAFFTLNVINGSMGYMKRLDDLALLLIVSLLCSFLPRGCILFFAALFTLLHMYEVSLEVAVVGLCLYLVISLLYLRFSPRDSLVVLLTPIACAIHVPYAVPVLMGLLGTPASAVSVGCGVVLYYFLTNVIANAQAISAMATEEAVAKVQLVVDVLIDNKEMLVMIGAFAATVIVVYLIRRLSVDYAWTIAILTGGIAEVIFLLIGDLRFDIHLSLANVIVGVVITMAVAKVVEFFRFCVDYNRTEKVQFEDDEYYYYVKAVPKMTVAAQSKTVKKITTRRKTSQTGRGGASAGRSRAAGKAGGQERNRKAAAPARQKTSQVRRSAARRDVFPEDGYSEENYAEDNYAEQNYAEQNYSEENFAEQNYAEQNFAEENYAGENYAEERYAMDNGYAEEEQNLEPDGRNGYDDNNDYEDL